MTALLVVAGSCHAAPVLLPGLFGTGLGADGVPLDGGAFDPHYAVLFAGMGRVIHAPGANWLPNSDSSRWIWQLPDGAPGGVERTIRTTFDLDDDVDFGMLTITGSWAVSGFGLDILINGISTQQTTSGATSWSSFTINHGFVVGTNTIDFRVENFGTHGGFRVDGIVGIINLPGSGSAGAMVIGGLVVARRRR